MPTPVRELMTEEVVTLDPEMTLKEVDRVLLSYRVSGGPVVEDGVVVGVVSRADVLQSIYSEQAQASKISGFYTSPFPIPLPSLDLMAHEARKIADDITHKKVREIMSTDLITVAPTDPIQAVAVMMAREGIHRVPVLDGDDLVGIVTSMDLVRKLGEVGLIGG